MYIIVIGASTTLYVEEKNQAFKQENFKFASYYQGNVYWRNLISFDEVRDENECIYV